MFLLQIINKDFLNHLNDDGVLEQIKHIEVHSLGLCLDTAVILNQRVNSYQTTKLSISTISFVFSMS